ncbi:GntR family transcriptional regulator [Chelatococcus sp. SYSU_G07232]|uniref:GntR family transcriptional regulator n=1 Tax=Chelatococcus albus TaxID=3047466 RepID=A0ABT7ADB2_9HYPH|nr:GntR family transcriptional regulator [Chelatococcus sp. SYSU_G07232]MDJ1157339.1 GntR family transcriptional regulator [Chelatococcus sp. SYSU_G07232]
MSDGATPSKPNRRHDLPRGEAVYRALRRAIIEQALRPGDKLPEDVIGERFGVSRTIVRGVLGRLHAEGLVELKLNRGATVARPSLEEACDIFEVRRSLERDVVRRLVGRVTPRQIALLEAHVAREGEARARGAAESIRLAGEFHILLAELSGNAVIARYINELVSRCSLILALYGRPHSPDCAVNEHLEIVAALRSGDAGKAIAVMEHHLDAVTERALLASARTPQRDIRAILDAYAP